MRPVSRCRGEWSDAFASKPAPTVVLQAGNAQRAGSGILTGAAGAIMGPQNDTKTCRSRLAGECGRSVAAGVNRLTRSPASRLLRSCCRPTMRSASRLLQSCCRPKMRQQAGFCGCVANGHARSAGGGIPTGAVGTTISNCGAYPFHTCAFTRSCGFSPSSAARRFA